MRLGVFAEGRHEAAAVASTGGQDDVAGLDTEDRETARARARDAASASLGRSWYAATIARLGYTDQQIAAVSDELVSAIVAHGDPDSIAATVGAHRAAGADHVILMPSATSTADLMAGVRQLEHLAPAVL
jgi:hypothetical protein